ncbi:MAG: imidazolonepropionase [Bacteroidales bacterium]|nr:imidazolonepropionase [Bacteroidales bacterium]
MSLLIRNIKSLLQIRDEGVSKVSGGEMAVLPKIDNAWVLTKDDRIIDFGEMGTIQKLEKYSDEVDLEIDAGGKMLLPAFCDSHTHLVFPASREIEYIDKIKGLSYEEIAKRGGGILNSAKRLHESSEDELFESAMLRLDEIISLGTGAVEIKSGYGLNTVDELKMLRVIRKLKEQSSMAIVSTFLGAHAIPAEYKGRQEAYVDMIISEMIPVIAAEELADYIDVFCDRGFFTVEDTDRILNAGLKYGLRPKIHANELANSGGIQVGVKYNALSVDHLEYTGKEEIHALLGSDTMPTLLPGASFFLGLVYAPARKMIDAGLPVAMASDYNPGSSPSGNMQFILSLGSIAYRMLPEEAINAVTINGAYAMGLSEEYGSIGRGKKANLILTKAIPSYEYLPYAYGSDKVEKVIIEGKLLADKKQ